MARAIWTGSVTFGLVNIPVRLYNATSPKDVRFRQLQRGTGRPIRYARVTAPPEMRSTFALPSSVAGRPAEREAGTDRPVRAETPPTETVREHAEPAPAIRTQEDVPYEDVVKGYEIDPGRYVVVDPGELEALEDERSRSIDIEDFVDLADIDPVYFEKSYYVAPQQGAEKPYALLVAAMDQAGKVAIGRFALRRKESLAAIRPVDGLLVLETLYYADEVRDRSEVVGTASLPAASERELSMAAMLIASMATDWDPSRYRDTYRERVMELIGSKATGEEPVVAEEPVGPAVPDLMAALRASVEAARSLRPAQAERHPGDPAKPRKGRGKGRRTG
jgi:DNA end-binding protein Ku